MSYTVIVDLEFHNKMSRETSQRAPGKTFNRLLEPTHEMLVLYQKAYHSSFPTERKSQDTILCAGLSIIVICHVARKLNPRSAVVLSSKQKIPWYITKTPHDEENKNTIYSLVVDKLHSRIMVEGSKNKKDSSGECCKAITRSVLRKRSCNK